MSINIVSNSDVFLANNLSAEFWCLNAAKHENFKKEFTQRELRLLSGYVKKIKINHAISSNLLDKIKTWLDSLVTWMDSDEDVYVLKLNSSEIIQKNIFLTELLPYAEEKLNLDINALKEKLKLLESMKY